MVTLDILQEYTVPLTAEEFAWLSDPLNRANLTKLRRGNFFSTRGGMSMAHFDATGSIRKVERPDITVFSL